MSCALVSPFNHDFAWFILTAQLLLDSTPIIITSPPLPLSLELVFTP